MLGVALAVLAAASNAVGSVLQRRASRDRPKGSSTWRAVLALLARPGWSVGIVAHVAGFALQGVALGVALISVVQPLLLAELPFTLILSALVFRAPLSRRAWAAVSATAVGLGSFLFCLSPSAGHPETTSPAMWLVGIGAGIAGVGILVGFALRAHAQRRALLFGAATGATYGLNAALLAGVALAYPQGWGAVWGTWQTYGVLVGGTASFVLLQQALQAGDLVAAQPGITLINPLVALVWGFAVFGEHAELGPWLAGAALAALAVVGGTVVLTRAALPRVASAAAADQPSDNPGEASPA